MSGCHTHTRGRASPAPLASPSPALAARLANPRLQLLRLPGRAQPQAAVAVRRLHQVPQQLCGAESAAPLAVARIARIGAAAGTRRVEQRARGGVHAARRQRVVQRAQPAGQRRGRRGLHGGTGKPGARAPAGGCRRPAGGCSSAAYACGARFPPIARCGRGVVPVTPCGRVRAAQEPTGCARTATAPEAGLRTKRHTHEMQSSAWVPVKSVHETSPRLVPSVAWTSDVGAGVRSMVPGRQRSHSRVFWVEASRLRPAANGLPASRNRTAEERNCAARRRRREVFLGALEQAKPPHSGQQLALFADRALSAARYSTADAG